MLSCFLFCTSSFAGARIFLKDKKRVDGLREAYENHRCVMADIADVRAQTSFDKTSDNMFTGVRYREYYLVECRYKDPGAGVTHIWYSPSLYFDPTELIIARAMIPAHFSLVLFVISFRYLFIFLPP